MRTFAVEVSADAESDIRDAERWLIENASVRAAAIVTDRVADCIERLTTDARHGAPRPQYGAGVRFLRAPPYFVYYEVFEDDRVVVLRILHQSRDRDAIMRGVQEEAEAFVGA